MSKRQKNFHHLSSILMRKVIFQFNYRPLNEIWKTNVTWVSVKMAELSVNWTFVDADQKFSLNMVKKIMTVSYRKPHTKNKYCKQYYLLENFQSVQLSQSKFKRCLISLIRNSWNWITYFWYLIGIWGIWKLLLNKYINK